MRDRRLVEQVQALYQSGVRKCDIARKLNQDTTNISRWCRKLSPLDKVTQTSSYQEKERYRWYTYENIDFTKIDRNSAKILLSLLYWCEGCKYPGTNKVEFVCSDEKMQVTFIKLMRVAFKNELDETKFRVMLQLHTTHNIDTQINYWSKLLDIPKTQFIKPHLTIKTGSRYRSVYNGTCNLRYFDYRLLLRIMGTYSQVSSQITN
ncbi:hypothetical protein KBD75_04390 [Candidatus Woesebacteria bacterium]|nr:hypothetical protein [Candidatus Woesebacteria bacterium]